MLRRKDVFTVITPIPSFIPRQLAIDILHSHSEIITLNPLVLDHKPIPAPRDAPADEYYCTWYEVQERIQLVPGTGKLGSSKISFTGCFHDMPWGVQTHTYAPFGIDLRIRYRVDGNQPGFEPPEHRELGLEALGAPRDGLYLRQDIEIRANISLISFTKAQLKSASKEMVDRIIRKAELVDAGVLQAMMSDDGRLKTFNTMDRSQTVRSPSNPHQQMVAAPRPNPGPGPGPGETAYVVPRPSSVQPDQQGQPGQPGQYPMSPGGYQQQQQQQQQPGGPYKPPPASFQAVEMPGDFHFGTPPPSFAAEMPAERGQP